MDRELSLVREAVQIVEGALVRRSDVRIGWGVQRPTDALPVAVSVTLKSWTPAERVLESNESINDATLALLVMTRENSVAEESILRDYYQPCAQALEQVGWTLEQGQQGIDDIAGNVYRVLEAGFSRIAV